MAASRRPGGGLGGGTSGAGSLQSHVDCTLTLALKARRFDGGKATCMATDVAQDGAGTPTELNRVAHGQGSLQRSGASHEADLTGKPSVLQHHKGGTPNGQSTTGACPQMTDFCRLPHRWLCLSVITG
jgi:hypothetical protein